MEMKCNFQLKRGMNSKSIYEQLIPYATENDKFKKGDIVKSFEYNSCIFHERYFGKYTYEIIDYMLNTSTNERIVIFKPHFSDDELNILVNDINIAPVDVFENAVVDKETFPDAKQKYVFELLTLGEKATVYTP